MWLLKILIKIIISRLPIEYSIWKKIGVFRHGGMDNYKYSKKSKKINTIRTNKNTTLKNNNKKRRREKRNNNTN